MSTGRAAQIAGAKAAFAPRHKSKCGRHKWEGSVKSGKNNEKEN